MIELQARAIVEDRDFKYVVVQQDLPGTHQGSGHAVEQQVSSAAFHPNGVQQAQ